VETLAGFLEWLKGIDWKAVAGFGFLSTLVGTLYGEIRRRIDAANAVRELVGKNLEPILKAADELSAKIRSLAEEDFREFRPAATQVGPKGPSDIDVLATVFLFAQFWSRLEIFRRDSYHVHLTKHSRAQVLLAFLRCLESRHVRLVDRAWQRGMGEAATDPRSDSKSMSFREFAEKYEDSPRFRAWYRPLDEALRATHKAKERQPILRYGAVIHALVDTLDPKHQSTRDRPPYPNKLSVKVRRQLAYGIFPVYLKVVTHPARYCGINRRR
jgi:hypothetical protein